MRENEDELIVSDADKTEATSVSQRKIDANRRNAKHSTGPRTVRGKRTSSFNALKHGLLSTRLMFDSEGKPEDGLHQLLESLRDEYGHGNVRVELLLEGVVADYWRQARGVRARNALFRKRCVCVSPAGNDAKYSSVLDREPPRTDKRFGVAGKDAHSRPRRRKYRWACRVQSDL
jgi:hypothetical protein